MSGIREPCMWRRARGARRRTLGLSPASVEEIRSHALSSYPRECCGFLIGSVAPFRRVSRLIRAANDVADARDRFAIAPRDFLAVDQHVRASADNST